MHSFEGEPLLVLLDRAEGAHTLAAPYPPGQYRRTRQATSSSRFATTDSSSVLRSSEHTTTEAHKGHSNPNHNGAPTVASWFLRHTLNSCLPSTGRRQRQVLPTFAPRYAALASSSMQQHARHNQPASAGAAGGGPVLTVRAIAAGLLVGSVLCFSNTYFGLQTGWVTMGSLQSAILGYGLFQGLGAAGLLSRHLSAAENVIVQTTAVATATMPLAAGLVGIIPALGLLTPEERPEGPVTFSLWELLAWCSALAFFGVFVAVPLRYQTIIREKLRFPSGTATASVIRTLHGLPPAAAEDEGDEGSCGGGSSGGGSNGGSNRAGPAAAGAWDGKSGVGLASDVEGQAAVSLQQQQQPGSGVGGLGGSGGSSSSKLLNQVDLEVAVWAEGDPEQSALLGGTSAAAAAAGGGSSSNGNSALQQQQQWARALRLLLWSFALSGAYSLAAAWIKPLKVWKVFDWVHLPAATAWGWVLQPSAGYIGQGMIMGPKTAWSMMAGAVTGWAILGPVVKAKGWAPGPIKDVQTGAAGWLMWLGLALLLGDCFSELALLVANTLYDKAVANGWISGGRNSRGVGGGGRRSPFVGHHQQQQQAGQGWYGSNGQQQQQQGGQLRSRPGSKGSLLAAAGCSVELSPNSSSSNVADAGSGSVGAGSSCSSHVVAVGLSPTAAAAAQHAGPAGSSGLAAAMQPPSTAAAASGVADAYAASEASNGLDDRDAQAWLLSPGFWVPGLLLSTGLATAVLSPMLHMPVYEPLVAVIVALLVALLAVRALGQTDLNPVSGVGKISQLVFAVVSPGAVLPNLVAGAIAEAGAQQAGDLMQDFKTAHLLGVAPSSQLVAMLVGSAASVPLSVAAYMLYTSAWQVPGPELPAPTAQIWLDMAKLVNGGHLPDHVAPFCAAAAAIAAALPVVQLLLKRLQRSQPPRRSSTTASVEYSALGTTLGSGHAAGGSLSSKPGSISSDSGVFAVARLWAVWRQRTAVDWALALMPSGVGFAVGCYLHAKWTLPRVVGSVLEQSWLLLSPQSHAAFMMVTASGLVLGEGCASVVTAVVQAMVKK